MKYSEPLQAMTDRLAEVPDDTHHDSHRWIAGRLKVLSAATEQLEVMSQRNDPTETEARHAERLAEAGRKLASRVESVTADIEREVREATRRLSAQAEETAGLRESPYASEIRQAVREMPAKSRHGVLNKALEDGDGATVAALTAAPTVVTGLDAEARDRFRHQFLAKHAPQETQALETLMGHYSTAAIAANQAKGAANAAQNPAFVSEIEKAKAQADEARQAFETVVQS
ncbi:hypothetical protein [Thioalkalivibrio sp. ALE9]|uniref:hypothetical protein n=1 Tax=Thioalkalivibrio sp. ALE9 TaxID=1158169 RepID=UPI000371C012|nr:hypothetical protein [Thioalkalivibrio sp. ALE9]